MYYVCMCVCKNIYRYSHPLPPRLSGYLYFAAIASMPAKRLTEACSFTALIALTAAIRIHCRVGPAALVHRHCCTGSVAAIVALTQRLKFAQRSSTVLVADIRSLCRAGAAVVFRCHYINGLAAEVHSRRRT
jgi:hypothetical protein